MIAEDFEFEAPAETPSGWTKIRFTNEGEFSRGEKTVAVRVTENPDGLMLHDLNLVRLEEGLPVDSIVAWMNWMDPSQFRSPAPGENLGGLEHMMADRTGYVSTDLAPGRYALVSEVYGSRGMVHEFTVE